MRWSHPQLIRICAPPEAECPEKWVEFILGAVVKPLMDKHGESITRVGILRYSDAYDHENPKGVPKLPERYQNDTFYRFIWLRMSIEDSSRDAVNQECITLINKANCHSPVGWQYYNLVEDLGKDHFTGLDSTPEAKARRAYLIADFLDATTRLMLDCLTKDTNEEWSFEENPGSNIEGHNINPHGSTFEAAHHLFCNSTGVPLSVMLLRNKQSQQNMIITHWTPGLSADEWDLIEDIHVQY